MKFVLTIILALHFACGDARSPAVITGINAAIAKARCAGYTQGLNPNDYRVETVKGEMYTPPGPGQIPLPVFRLPCGVYCGTGFDQGGFVYAAGQFIPPNTIKLPDTAGAQAAEFEFEHHVLYHNDRAEYQRTAIHTIESGHPIIPAC